MSPLPDYLPSPERDGGICLALSGGGFRATLFHLGALRRINELGIIGKLAAISSVSGGSIMSLCLAKAMIDRPLQNGTMVNFDDLVAKVHEITSYNLRRQVVLNPLNWGPKRGERVAKQLARRVTDKTLADLPQNPLFIFCATDMAFGANWEYSRLHAGDYQAGYKINGLNTIKLAHAAACSACFPPVFAPLDTDVRPNELVGGHAQGKDADACRQRIRLSDGGVYDNMGLEPLWKHANTLLVSNAGGVFEYARDRGTLSDVKRYPDIVGNQALALRRRWLIASFGGGAGPGGRAGLSGTYWATSGDRTSYDPADKKGYSPATAMLISQIRTDLDHFSEGETAALENHGYLMADIAVRVHVPALYGSSTANPPYPAWMDEAIVRDALKDSAKRRIL